MDLVGNLFLAGDNHHDQEKMNFFKFPMGKMKGRNDL